MVCAFALFILKNNIVKSNEIKIITANLNGMPSGKSSYLLWHNPNTGNHGDIKITRSYIENNFKCVDYTSTVSIQDGWPMNGIGSLDRSTEFGKACQLPDGRWQVIERVL